jgi:hypothetical protein
LEPAAEEGRGFCRRKVSVNTSNGGRRGLVNVSLGYWLAAIRRVVKFARPTESASCHGSQQQSERFGIARTVIKEDGTGGSSKLFNERFTLKVIVLEDFLIISEIFELGRAMGKLETSIVESKRMLLPTDILNGSVEILANDILAALSCCRICINSLIGAFSVRRWEEVSYGSSHNVWGGH